MVDGMQKRQIINMRSLVGIVQNKSMMVECRNCDARNFNSDPKNQLAFFGNHKNHLTLVFPNGRHSSPMATFQDLEDSDEIVNIVHKKNNYCYIMEVTKETGG